MQKGQFTRQEIFSQPEAWADALGVLETVKRDLHGLLHGQQYAQVIFTGCGSTYYLSLSAAAKFQNMTGISARAFPASELLLYPDCSYTAQKTLLVAISRSGETTETLRACDAFLNKGRGTLLTLSCYPEMPLATMGMLNIVLPSGQEQSVAQTRAFSTLLLGSLALTCLWAGRLDLFDSFARLPEAGRNVLEKAQPLSLEIGANTNLDRFYWLGSGAQYGLAAELSLKMKEMSLTHSEPFHFLEFRHGPKSMVTDSSMVIGLPSVNNYQYESAVLDDVRSLGGRVLDLGLGDGLSVFNTGTGQVIRDMLFLPPGQLIAFERSLSKGLDPDLPTNLDAVVKLKEVQE